MKNWRGSLESTLFPGLKLKMLGDVRSRMTTTVRASGCSAHGGGGACKAQRGEEGL